MDQKPQMKIDLKATTPYLSEDGNALFVEGIILRKVSKFLSGTGEEGVIPIPAFYDVKTGKIEVNLLPPELREEYIKYNQTLNPLVSKVHNG